MDSNAVSTIAVVGAGVMGRGIALVSALSGFTTRVIETNPKAVDSARAEMERLIARGQEKGEWDAGKAAAARRNLTWPSALEGAAGAEIVIEAVPESIGLKAEVYRGLGLHLAPKAIIATNTSSLSITELAATSGRPDRFVGMHFFNPVHRMRLIELVRGLETSDTTLQITDAVSKRLGKETVLVRESPGFVTSRVNVLIGNEAFHMLESGVASAPDIDKALKLGLNHPMGPFELVDLVGLDTRLSILEYLHRSLGERFRPNPLLVQYVKAGRLGRKVGRGIYDYPAPEAKPAASKVEKP
jgi:3-hydroxybutyryl-CoA dehydrogenase